MPGVDNAGPTGDDATSAAIALPFSWTYYGTSYAYIYVCTNGWVGFSNSTTNTAAQGYYNSCLPQTLTTAGYDCVTGPAMLPYWDDLYIPIGGGIFTSTTGTAPNRVFNIEWRDTYLAGGQSCNFEVRLYENQPRFDFIYGAMNTGGSGGTIGCQSDAGVSGHSTSFACDTANNNAPASGTILTFQCPDTFPASCGLGAQPRDRVDRRHIPGPGDGLSGRPRKPPVRDHS